MNLIGKNKTIKKCVGKITNNKYIRNLKNFDALVY